MTCATLLVFFILTLVASTGGATHQIIASKAEIYSLPPLDFAYDALEPNIDEATLIAHHTGHHQAYCTKMNAALRAWRSDDRLNTFSTEPILEVLRDLDQIPEAHRTAIVNNGGGYVNHVLYWATMSPQGGGSPTGKLLGDIQSTFGSFEMFQEQFNRKALTLFGSGYVWLSRKGSELVLSTTINQDSPISQGLNPILVLDVWEHAYYLKHQFRRVNYIDLWWNVVDWTKVEELDGWWTADRDQVHHVEL